MPILSSIYRNKFSFRILLLMLIMLVGVSTASAQKERPKTDKTDSSVVHASAAFSEILAQKALVEADLKILLTDYKEDYIGVREKQAEFALLNTALRNLEKTPAAEISKLTLALGKLVVKKIEVEAELKTLLEDYTEDFPAVKKARTRLGVYEEEIRKLLAGKTTAN